MSCVFTRGSRTRVGVKQRDVPALVLPDEWAFVLVIPAPWSTNVIINPNQFTLFFGLFYNIYTHVPKNSGKLKAGSGKLKCSPEH